MTLLAMPDAPPSPKGLRQAVPRADISAALASADRRRTCRVHRAVLMDKGEEGYRDVEPLTEICGGTVTVRLPGVYSMATPEALCELVTHAFRRTEDPSLPMFGPTVMAFMSTDLFRRLRLWALGTVGDEKQEKALLKRRSMPPGRLATLFMARMEDEAPFMMHLLRVRRIRLLPLSDSASGPYGAYPDPYTDIVLYDRKALDPAARPLACLYALYRSCAVIECYDRRTGVLDERRLSLLMDMCPWPEGKRSCERDGVRLQEFPSERRLMLP